MQRVICFALVSSLLYNYLMNRNPKNKYGQGNKFHEYVKNAGAPSKFDPKYITEIIDFFSSKASKEYVYESSTEYFANGELKKKSEKKKPIPRKLPTLLGFADSIGVKYQTVRDWAEKGEDPEYTLIDPKKEYTAEELVLRHNMVKSLSDFAHSYKKAKELQKEFLIENGLSGASPAPAFIFVAKNLTDMRDKVETDITSKGKEIVGFTITRITKEDVKPIEN